MRLDHITMNKTLEYIQNDNSSQTWTDLPQHSVVVELLDKVCPQAFCNDVDRAILGASMGG